MVGDAGLRMMELAGKGYCCSQIMVLLTLDEMDRENPDLVRAAAGLCNGLGDCSGPCGVLTGAAMVLGLFGGKGTDLEEAEEVLPVMLESLRDWFAERTAEHGGTTCGHILDGRCGQADPVLCGGLLADAHEKVREIVAENNFDPAEGRDMP